MTSLAIRFKVVSATGPNQLSGDGPTIHTIPALRPLVQKIYCHGARPKGHLSDVTRDARVQEVQPQHIQSIACVRDCGGIEVGRGVRAASGIGESPAVSSADVQRVWTREESNDNDGCDSETGGLVCVGWLLRGGTTARGEMSVDIISSPLALSERH